MESYSQYGRKQRILGRDHMDFQMENGFGGVRVVTGEKFGGYYSGSGKR